MPEKPRDISAAGEPAPTHYGTARPDAPRGSPDYEHLLPAFRHFVEEMRAAQFVFENEDDIEGCKLALRAAMKLLARRHIYYWRVFAEIDGAFTDLKKGTDPELFSRTPKARPRSRSARREHAQILSAVCLSWLMERGQPLKQAAAFVARKVDKWPEFEHSPISGDTVRHWRDEHSRGDTGPYHRILQDLGADPDADKRVAELLDGGPPASPAPRNTL